MIRPAYRDTEHANLIIEGESYMRLDQVCSDRVVSIAEVPDSARQRLETLDKAEYYIAVTALIDVSMVGATGDAEAAA